MNLRIRPERETTINKWQVTGPAGIIEDGWPGIVADAAGGGGTLWIAKIVPHPDQWDNSSHILTGDTGDDLAYDRDQLENVPWYGDVAPESREPDRGAWIGEGDGEVDYQ